MAPFLAIPLEQQNARVPKKAPCLTTDVAMGHNLCLHFGADEHPCTTYSDVHQGYRVLTHGHVTEPSAERILDREFVLASGHSYDHGPGRFRCLAFPSSQSNHAMEKQWPNPLTAS